MLNFLLRIAITWMGVIFFFSACSSLPSKEDDFSFKEIAFRNIQQDTRVKETTDITNFRISAVWTKEIGDYEQSFMDKIFVKKDGTKWQYSPLYYWPSVGTVDFFAYSPGESSGVKTFDISASSTNYSGGDITIKYDVTTDNKLQEDFLIAEALNQDFDTNSGEVKLDFKHMLSYLLFKVKVGTSNFAIKTLAVHNVYRRGTLVRYADSKTWKWTSNKDGMEIYNVNMPEFKLGENSNYFSIDSLVILPQVVSIGENILNANGEPEDLNKNFYFVITYENSSKTKTIYIPLSQADGSKFEFKKGTHYTINIDLEPISRSKTRFAVQNEGIVDCKLHIEMADKK